MVESIDTESVLDKITGIPILINTSFNENEPIICNPNEAVDCYLCTKMDVLVLGNFFCQNLCKLKETVNTNRHNQL